jgi:hypothetical protein
MLCWVHMGLVQKQGVCLPNGFIWQKIAFSYNCSITAIRKVLTYSQMVHLDKLQYYGLLQACTVIMEKWHIPIGRSMVHFDKLQYYGILQACTVIMEKWYIPIGQVWKDAVLGSYGHSSETRGLPSKWLYLTKKMHFLTIAQLQLSGKCWNTPKWFTLTNGSIKALCKHVLL